MIDAMVRVTRTEHCGCATFSISVLRRWECESTKAWLFDKCYVLAWMMDMFTWGQEKGVKK